MLASGSTWDIVIEMPFLALPLLALALLALAGGLAWMIHRLLSAKRRLSERAQALEAQVARLGAAESAPAHPDAYRQFISTLSHDGMTLLQTAEASLTVLGECSPAQLGLWRQAHASATDAVLQLSAMLSKLRDLSRIEAQGAPSIREPVNLKRLVEGVIMAAGDGAEARHVRLRYMGPDRLARVLGDEGQLRQAVANLVDNAIKYSRPEGGDVIIALREEADRLCLRVSDEGIGIGEEHLPHVFDTAYRAPDPHALRRAGSGLGLAIVKRIVERHGGQVSAQSELGRGSTFGLDLPIYLPPDNTQRETG